MNARTFDQSKLRNRHVTVGGTRVPGRSSGHATGAAFLDVGNVILIDAEKGTLGVELSEAELAKRRNAWKTPPNPYQSGALRMYADQVRPARKGAATYAAGGKEVVCYAEI